MNNKSIYDLGTDLYKKIKVANDSQENKINKRYGYVTSRFSTEPKGWLAGPLMVLAGFLVGCMFLACGILLFLMSALTGGGASLLLIVWLLAILAFVICGKGLSYWTRAKRFRMIAKKIGTRDYVSVDELTELMGRSRENLLKDLRLMISSNMIYQGHLDKEETTLMVTHEVYQQYLQTAKAVENKNRQEREKDLERKSNRAACSKEVQDILQEGEKYISHIHSVKEGISDAVMMEKLSKLEQVLKGIFEQLEKDPSRGEDLRKLMNYYLPTTKKMLDTYGELSRQSLAGENITSAKKEIVSGLDTINQAFANLLNRMYQEKAWDISTDLSVMKTMMAQEGLVHEELQMPFPTEK